MSIIVVQKETKNLRFLAIAPIEFICSNKYRKNSTERFLLIIVKDLKRSFSDMNNIDNQYLNRYSLNLKLLYLDCTLIVPLDSYEINSKSIKNRLLPLLRQSQHGIKDINEYFNVLLFYSI